MKRISLLLFALFATCLCACTDESDADDIVLLITCSDSAPEAGQTIYFDIDAYTRHDSIRNISVTSFDAENRTQTLDVIEVGSKTFYHRFFYEAPSFAADLTDVELTFAAESNEGASQRITRTITVSAERLLPEHTGFEIHSPTSGKPDAFSMEAMQTLRTEDNDASAIDIYVPADEDNPDALSRRWLSRTGMMFSKADNFNYASATHKSLVQTYANSTRYNSATELEVNDIILIGHGEAACAAIKIVGISDGEGCDDDYYLFNIKVIR